MVILSSSCPLLSLARSVSPALAMGNTVIVKPALQTSLTALLFAELCAEAGLPPGVINVITGDDAFEEKLAANLAVKAVTFTGTTEVCISCVGHTVYSYYLQINSLTCSSPPRRLGLLALFCVHLHSRTIGF